MHSLPGRGQASRARPTIRETGSHECASNRRDLAGIYPGSPIHCCDEEFTTPQRRGADLAVPKPREVSISSVKFERYKAFRSFSISLQRVNILVGPNNCGKSTIIRAFRVLDIALRQARRRNAQRISYNGHTSWGHRLSEDRLPISLENIHTDYEDTDAKVTFRCSNGNLLILVFPPDGGCFLIPDAQGRDCRTPGNFKNRFPIDIQVVPELGPLEDEEILLAEETVRRGTLYAPCFPPLSQLLAFIPTGFQRIRRISFTNMANHEHTTSRAASGTSRSVGAVVPEIDDVLPRRSHDTGDLLVWLWVSNLVSTVDRYLAWTKLHDVDCR